MTLEELRHKAFFQNTIDIWIAYNVDTYRRFVGHLISEGIKMQKFPLCIKESGGTIERGKDKAQFLDQLSKISSDDAGAYTIKLTGYTIAAIRSFVN
jgi:hypothetical protein